MQRKQVKIKYDRPRTTVLRSSVGIGDRVGNSVSGEVPGVEKGIRYRFNTRNYLQEN
jgi:hypothetical protein